MSFGREIKNKRYLALLLFCVLLLVSGCAPQKKPLTKAQLRSAKIAILKDSSLSPTQKFQAIARLTAPPPNPYVAPSLTFLAMSPAFVVGYNRRRKKKMQQLAEAERQRRKIERRLRPQVEPTPPPNQYEIAQKRTDAIPVATRAVSFFTSQPMSTSDLVDVTVLVNYQVRVVRATPQEADLVRQGKTPLVRAFTVGKTTLPWYEWDGYIPFKHYWSGEENSWFWRDSQITASWVDVDTLEPSLSGYFGYSKHKNVEWDEAIKTRVIVKRWLGHELHLNKCRQVVDSPAFRRPRISSTKKRSAKVEVKDEKPLKLRKRDIRRRKNYRPKAEVVAEPKKHRSKRTRPRAAAKTPAPAVIAPPPPPPPAPRQPAWLTRRSKAEMPPAVRPASPETLEARFFTPPDQLPEWPTEPASSPPVADSIPSQPAAGIEPATATAPEAPAESRRRKAHAAPRSPKGRRRASSETLDADEAAEELPSSVLKSQVAPASDHDEAPRYALPYSSPPSLTKRPATHKRIAPQFARRQTLQASGVKGRVSRKAQSATVEQGLSGLSESAQSALREAAPDIIRDALPDVLNAAAIAPTSADDVQVESGETLTVDIVEPRIEQADGAPAAEETDVPDDADATGPEPTADTPKPADLSHGLLRRRRKIMEPREDSSASYTLSSLPPPPDAPVYQLPAGYVVLGDGTMGESYRALSQRMRRRVDPKPQKNAAAHVSSPSARAHNAYARKTSPPTSRERYPRTLPLPPPITKVENEAIASRPEAGISPARVTPPKRNALRLVGPIPKRSREAHSHPRAWNAKGSVAQRISPRGRGAYEKLESAADLSTLLRRRIVAAIKPLGAVTEGSVKRQGGLRVLRKSRG